MARRYKGVVAWFNSDWGGGVIIPDDEGIPDLFVHYTSIDPGSGPKVLQEGDSVNFEIVETDNLGMVASNVRKGGSLLGAWSIRRARSKRG